MKISIIMASYNYANFIKEGIESILAQTYNNWELLVIDDGSTDNSVDIIKSYCEKYSNISLFTHENNQNKGLNESLLLGLSKVNGDFIAFLESDDYWHQDYLQEKVNIIKKQPDVKFIFNAVEVFGDEEAVYEHYKNTADNLPVEEKTDTYEYIPLRFLDMNVASTFSSLMIEKNALEGCNFNVPYGPFLDWWLTYQISLQHKLYYLNKKLTFWRMHKKSYTNDKYNIINKKKIEFYHNRLYLSYMKNIYKMKYSFIQKLLILPFLTVKLLTSSRKINKIFRGFTNRLQDQILKIV